MGPVVMAAGNLQVPGSQATSRTTVFNAVYTALRSNRLRIEGRQSGPSCEKGRFTTMSGSTGFGEQSDCPTY